MYIRKVLRGSGVGIRSLLLDEVAVRADVAVTFMSSSRPAPGAGLVSVDRYTPPYTSATDATAMPADLKRVPKRDKKRRQKVDKRAKVDKKAMVDKKAKKVEKKAKKVDKKAVQADQTVDKKAMKLNTQAMKVEKNAMKVKKAMEDKVKKAMKQTNIPDSSSSEQRVAPSRTPSPEGTPQFCSACGQFRRGRCIVQYPTCMQIN